jgi:hypothetical protein
LCCLWWQWRRSSIMARLIPHLRWFVVASSEAAQFQWLQLCGLGFPISTTCRQRKSPAAAGQVVLTMDCASRSPNPRRAPSAQRAGGCRSITLADANGVDPVAPGSKYCANSR